MHGNDDVFLLAGAFVEDYMNVRHVPTFADAGPQFIGARLQVAKTELAVGSGAASSQPFLFGVITGINSWRQQIFRFVKDFHERVFQWPVVWCPNFSLQLAKTSFLNHDDHFVAAPSSAIAPLWRATVAITENSWRKDESEGQETDRAEQGCFHG